MKLTIEARRALGKALVARRLAQNLTQEKLIAIAGVSISSLQRAERGNGISQEGLDAIALALRTSADELLAAATKTKEASPELRLKLAEVTEGEVLVRQMRAARGVVHVGPEGEHAFNEQIGGQVHELADTHDPQARRDADYILEFCAHMGFRLFTCSYHEVIKHKGKLVRNPTTLAIATPSSDPRVHKTAKGFVLDYVTDSRRQFLHQALNTKLTFYDWAEDQLISRSNGEARVRAELARMNDKIRKKRKK